MEPSKFVFSRRWRVDDVCREKPVSQRWFVAARDAACGDEPGTLEPDAVVLREGRNHG